MSAGEWLWVDGEPDAMVPADDRGLLLADGLFETIRLEGREPCLFDYHCARMAAGLAVLQFPNPTTSATDALTAAVNWACAHPGHAGNGILRLTLTRGSGPRGYLPPACPALRSIARLTAGLPTNSEPARLTTVSVAWSEQAQLAGLKLLARAEQSLASLEAQQLGYDDALMRDSNGMLVSSATGNLFIRRANTLYTPTLSRCGIAGTRRAHIVSSLGKRCGFVVQEVTCELAMLESADEVFVCNAVVGVRPVQSVSHGGHTWSFPDQSAYRRLSPLIHQSLSGVA